MLSEEGSQRQPAGVKVAVIIVTWNSAADIGTCLQSLFKYHPELDLKVVVVDNHSADNTADIVKNRFPQVILEENYDNEGFARAVNLGLRKLKKKPDWILLLNPDTVFESNSECISRDKRANRNKTVPCNEDFPRRAAVSLQSGVIGGLIDFMAEHPDAAAAGPKVIGEDGKIQAGCRRREPTVMGLFSRITGLERLFPSSRRFSGYTYGDIPEDTTHEVEALSGSFMLIRKKALDKVGPLDERYFMYAEDLDWCRRAREKGFSLWYVPEFTVKHLKGQSSAGRPIVSAWFMNSTAALYIAKNYHEKYPFPLRFFMYLALSINFAVSAGKVIFRRLLRKILPK